jgi:hypothetical protein
MASTTINNLGVTFPDATVQNTAYLGNGGSTVTSSATSITLTNASTKVQEVAFTAANQAVILPDATTYTSSTVGSPIFLIVNNGTFAFDIKNSSGYGVFTVAPSQSAIISLAGNTTQNQWTALQSNLTFSLSSSYPSIFATGTSSSAIILGKGTSSNISTTNSVTQSNAPWISISSLSTTSLIACWLNGTTGYLYGAVGTISGTSISWGTPTLISSTTSFNVVSCVGLSSTTALVAVATSSGVSPLYAYGLAISGTTITPSARGGSFNASNTTSRINLYAVSSTTALMIFNDNLPTIYEKVLTYNGASAPTASGGINQGAQTGEYAICQLTATTYLLCYGNNSTGFLMAGVLTVSGTTITIGTQVSTVIYGSGQYQFALIPISSTEVLFTTATNGSLRMTISGTTVTMSTSFGQSVPFLEVTSGYNFMLSSTDFVVLGGNFVQSLFRYTYTSSTGPVLKGAYSFNTLPLVASTGYISSGNAVCAGIDVNGYPTSSLLYLLN